MIKPVSACAEISLLSDGSMLTNFNFSQAVGIHAISEAGSMVHDEIPWHGNSGALMNEGRSSDRGSEQLQPDQSPAVQGLWSPGTKECPAEIPGKQAQAYRP
jgi:hypothetical protein